MKLITASSTRWIIPRAFFAACLLGGAYFAGSLFFASFGDVLMQNDGPPKLEIGRTEYDFGLVAAGPVLQTQFKVENRGQRRLILVQKSASCECAYGDSAEIIIPPGQSRLLPVAVETERIEGAMDMRVHYWTNDPERPTLDLRLLVECKASI